MTGSPHNMKGGHMGTRVISSIGALGALGLLLVLGAGCADSQAIVGPSEAADISARAAAETVLEIKIAPAQLVLATPGSWVTVHTNVSYSLVDASTVELEGIPAISTFSDDCGNLVAKFDRDEICAIVAPPEATLTLTAFMVDGEFISGSDTITVFERLNTAERI